ncbi:hypothetical protein Q9189_001725 [Teloschistes chrysophthalmus]
MTCYVGADTKFSLSDTTLCGEPVNGDSACCIGSDSCMENFICHFTHTQANMSGYYVQGCTDSTHLISTAGISAPLVTTTLIPSSSTTNVTQANLPTPNTSRWSGFSGGATAGITVGAVVGVLALLALAFFLFRSPRRRTTDPGHRVKREPVSDPRAYTGSMQELGADYNIELDSTIRVELDSRTRAELELGRGVKVPFKGYRGKSAIGGVEF